jgi:4-coumarate--CoA ligase
MGCSQTWGRHFVRTNAESAVDIFTSISSGANPDFTSDELLYQLQQTKASLMVVHPEALNTALSAAQAYGFSPERIILFDGKSPSAYAANHRTVEDVANLGLSKPDSSFVERRLQPGEAKVKLAFLSFSSGTTGKPKVSTLLAQILEYRILSCCRLLLFLILLQ